MTVQMKCSRVLSAAALAGILSLAPVAQADSRCVEQCEPIVIRRTIPDPLAVDRGPLTSDRLSTTSTRLIDARRGFRPYSSVHGDRGYGHRYPAYDDHFGISRPENRPYSYSQRTPRSFVSHFRNEARPIPATAMSSQAQPAYTLILREQPAANAAKPDMAIRIHKDRSAIPTTTGAVLITADGTVIQVGD